MPEQQLNRWLKRIALLFVVILVAFVAFYVFDRYNPIPQQTIADRDLQAAEQAIQADPADIAARGTLADIYVAAGRYEDAVAQYNAILDTGKGEELARIGRARALEKLGRVDEAAADWQRVVDIALPGEMANVDPNLALAFYRLGIIALDKGDAQTAVDNLSKTLKITRSDADALVAIGRAYTQLGDTDQAIESFTRAASFVPVGWPDPYTGLADAYTQQGDTAMATWASAMAANASGDSANAEKQLRTLLDGPADLEAAMGLGLVMETRGEGQLAVEWYQRVLEKDPANQAALLAMARVRPVEPAPSAAASPAASQEGSN
jgi:tetratricopeptide (TPR) repeat protein